MPVYRGTVYERIFKIQNGDGLPIDITGWTFRADVRETVEGVAVLDELTTELGNFEVIEPLAGRFKFTLKSANTTALTAGKKYLFDFLRTDGVEPVYVIGGNFKAANPITRND